MSQIPPSSWYLRIENKLDRLEDRMSETPTRKEIMTLIVALFTIVGITVTAAITLAG